MSFKFDEQMAMADEPAVQEAISAYIRQNFAGVESIERASADDDRRGTDYWVILESGKKLSLDVKIRKTDYAFQDQSQDDLALELWSVVGAKTGWTRDASKMTDFVLWHWNDSGRDCMLSFPALCSVFQEKADEWTAEFINKVITQTTVSPNGDSYQSQFVFVPRKVVIQAMLSKFAGKPAELLPVNAEQEESALPKTVNAAQAESAPASCP